MNCGESGVQALLHYLDDFLIIGAPNLSECQASLSILLGTYSISWVSSGTKETGGFDHMPHVSGPTN